MHHFHRTSSWPPLAFTFPTLSMPPRHLVLPSIAVHSPLLWFWLVFFCSWKVRFHTWMLGLNSLLHWAMIAASCSSTIASSTGSAPPVSQPASVSGRLPDRRIQTPPAFLSSSLSTRILGGRSSSSMISMNFVRQQWELCMPLFSQLHLVCWRCLDCE